MHAKKIIFIGRGNRILIGRGEGEGGLCSGQVALFAVVMWAKGMGCPYIY